MEVEEFIRIPEDRVAVLIGKNNATKREIEKTFSCRVVVDESGDVTIRGNDALKVLRARDVVMAIGRGFSPQNAMKLKDESLAIDVINLQEMLGNKSRVIRQKARIIGKSGTARKQIEEMTNTIISVYGKTVSIIGPVSNVKIARDAITMLASGAKHSTVYNFLSRNAHLIDEYPF